MRIVKTSEYSSLDEVRSLLRRPHLDEVEVSSHASERTKQIFNEALTPVESVERILQDVKKDGDKALLNYIEKIDGQKLSQDELLVSTEEIKQAEEGVSKEFLESLQVAIENVRTFHEKQLTNSWFSTDSDGNILGQRVIPLDKVGIYVPGGNAPLISTVVMSAIPARVAGVNEIWMATPLRDGKVDPHLLVAAQRCGVTKILKAGGAQAIAALAYGTETIPQVDKVVGPGNLYVTLAKKMVYGRVGIESLAGPSEILVLADETASAQYIAADLLSQAEHDWEAASCLITTSERLANEVAAELEKQVEQLSTKEIAKISLERWGLLVVAKDMDEAIELTNIFAAEHLELMVKDPWAVLGKIKNAGAVFMGQYSTEPIGDYVAGPNHILPTNGTARFSSPLTTDDFLKKSSIIFYNEEGIRKFGPDAIRIAELEGLAAHANAVRLRVNNLTNNDGGGSNDD